MDILAVGQPFDPSVLGSPEGCHYNYDRSGHWLYYLYNKPREEERRSIQSGDAEFGLYINGPVLFLLHRFGDMAWNDASYCWWRVAEEDRAIPEISDSLHALLKVVMVDTSNSMVVALRALTFSAEFTRRLHEVIRYQARHQWSASYQEQIVSKIYSKFTINDLVWSCEIFCKGGE